MTTGKRMQLSVVQPPLEQSRIFCFTEIGIKQHVNALGSNPVNHLQTSLGRAVNIALWHKKSVERKTKDAYSQQLGIREGPQKYCFCDTMNKKGGGPWFTMLGS